MPPVTDYPRREISRLIAAKNLLNKDEERVLLAAAQDGDEDARNELITRNLGLVAKNARYYQQYTTVPFEDLMQEGTLGLFTAINKFDLEKEWRFSTYATWWIRHHIGRHMTNHGRTIRIPSRIIDLKRKYLNERELYMLEFGVEPTRDEVAALLGVSPAAIDEMLTYSAPISSLDYSIKNKTGGGFNSELGTMGDLIADEAVAIEQTVVETDVLTLLSDAIKSLEPIEQMVILRYYNIGAKDSEEKRPTKTALVEELGLPNLNRFNTILNAAMEKLRVSLAGLGDIDDLFQS